MELLAPAGDYPAFLAAVNNGADAVYLGSKRFHARQKDVSFAGDTLVRSLDYAHERGRKIYVTLNILLDSSEVEEALDDAYDLYGMGVDALIVQDVGLMRLLKEALPEMRIHASTQATIYNAEGLRFMQQYGVKRTVLARETSLEEIIRMKQAVSGMELEVFIHGALCYSYSGQCLFSSLVGGRSGNRGRCAQPCRKPYRLLGQKNPQGITLPPHSRYLLSTADQCLLESLPKLDAAGVTSLKIEGRLKKPEYVAMVTRCYRQVLDRLPELTSRRELEEMEKAMQGMFNRGFTQDYLLGKRRVLRVDKPDNRGILAGRVEGKKDGSYLVRAMEELRQNDGILLKGIHGEEISFTLRQMEADGKKVNRVFPGETLSLRLRETVLTGEKVYKTRDTRLLEAVQPSLREQKLGEENRNPLTVKLRLVPGEAAVLEVEDRNGRRAEVVSETAVTLADNHPVQPEKIREKLARLGNTTYYLKDLQVELDPQAMFPFSELNRMRRLAVEKLEAQDEKIQLDESAYLARKNAYYKRLYGSKLWDESRVKPLLAVRAGSIPAALAAVKAGADRVILDMEPFTPVHHTPDMAGELFELANEYTSDVFLALPRIRRGNGMDALLERWVERWPKAGYLLATWGDVVWAEKRKLRFAVDHSLNCTNEVSYEQAVKAGAESVCLSPELSGEQMSEFHDLSRAEIPVQGEIILMVSEGCVFHNTMPPTADGKCPHYCARDQYALQDEKGYQFPLAHDAHCRQYVLNSRTLSLWEELDEILAWKPMALRIEAQRYTPEQIETAVGIYRGYLNAPYEEPHRIQAAKELLREGANSAFTRGHYRTGTAE